jgi:hypothetical protein
VWPVVLANAGAMLLMLVILAALVVKKSYKRLD